MDTSLHYILNTFSNKAYPCCQVKIPNIYKRVTTKSYGLNRLDDTMADLQTIHWATQGSTQCIFWISVTCIYALLQTVYLRE